MPTIACNYRRVTYRAYCLQSNYWNDLAEWLSRETWATFESDDTRVRIPRLPKYFFSLFFLSGMLFFLGLLICDLGFLHIFLWLSKAANIFLIIFLFLKNFFSRVWLLSKLRWLVSATRKFFLLTRPKLNRHNLSRHKLSRHKLCRHKISRHNLSRHKLCRHNLSR